MQTADWQLSFSTPITGGVDPRRAFRTRELPSNPERPLFFSMVWRENGVNHARRAKKSVPRVRLDFSNINVSRGVAC